MSAGVSSNELDLLTQPLDHGLVVQANAGTGKTYSITALIAREISKVSLSDASATEVEDFLIVTFTNNAASDLRVRTREQLSKLRGELIGSDDDPAHLAVEKALGTLDRAAISTIHQFCGSILRLAGLPLSEVVEERVVKSVINAVASDLVVNRSEAGAQDSKPVIAKKLSEFLEVLLSNPDVELAGLTTASKPELTKELTQLIQDAREEVRRRLESSLTHDETVRRALSLLEQSEKSDGLLLQQVRGMYRYCIIDESQDTDK
jgi:ATP-dependent exoDNAse (exonuclease V) beta subunit